MRNVSRFIILAILGVAAALALVLSSRGAEDPALANRDLGPPPPCFESWEEAADAGLRPPGTGGADSGLVLLGDLPALTPEERFLATTSDVDFDGPPPPGCDSWEEFIAWAAKWIFPMEGEAALPASSASFWVTDSVDRDPPPPCLSPEEAEAQGWEHADFWIDASDPEPTDGPPFDITKTPPPPGFDSWDQVIDLWTEADRLGVFRVDLDPPTPEFEGPPPLGLLVVAGVHPVDRRSGGLRHPRRCADP